MHATTWRRSFRHSLARVYEAQGKYELSLPLLLQNLEARRRALGAEHFDTMLSLSALAGSYRKQGRYREAELLFTQLLEVRRRTLTPDNPTTLSTLTLGNVAALLRRSVTRSDTHRPATARRCEADPR